MEKKDTALEVKGTTVKRRRKKSKTTMFKKMMHVLWLKIKAVFTKNKRSGKKKATTRKNEKKVPLGKKIRIVVLNLLGMALLVFLVPFLALKWLDSYTNHGEEHVVPDVCGMVLEDASDVLKGKALGCKVIEFKHREGAAENEVLMQFPEPGAFVKEGRKIALVLNTTVKPKRAIPSVIDNRTFREAESHIKAAGFIIEKIDTIAGEKDWVYEVRFGEKSLVNGDAIPQGSRITVVIGNGKKPLVEEEPVFDSNYDI